MSRRPSREQITQAPWCSCVGLSQSPHVLHEGGELDCLVYNEEEQTGTVVTTNDVISQHSLIYYAVAFFFDASSSHIVQHETYAVEN